MWRSDLFITLLIGNGRSLPMGQNKEKSQLVRRQFLNIIATKECFDRRIYPEKNINIDQIESGKKASEI
jgi:hypothetical protein